MCILLQKCDASWSSLLQFELSVEQSAVVTKQELEHICRLLRIHDRKSYIAFVINVLESPVVIRVLGLRCLLQACCASGLVCLVSGTASASDLARPECELWQTQNGIWNPDVLLYDALGMFFVRAGSWSTSPARHGQCEWFSTPRIRTFAPRWASIWNPDVLLYGVFGMLCLRAGSCAGFLTRPVRVI